MIEKKRTGWKKRDSETGMFRIRTAGAEKLAYSGRRYRGKKASVVGSGSEELDIMKMAPVEYHQLLVEALPVITEPGNEYHSIDTSGGNVKVDNSDEKLPNATTRLAIAECDILFNVMQSFRR